MTIDIKPSHKGLLHKKLHVPEGQAIPAKKLNSAGKKAKPGSALSKEINFAKNAKKFHH